MIKKFTFTVRVTAVLVLLVNTFVTCSVAQKKSNSSGIYAVRLKEVMQFVNLETLTVADFGKNVDIIYYQDFVIYHIADTMYAERQGVGSASVPDTLTSPYIVSRRGQPRGRVYQFLDSRDYQNVLVDSIVETMLMAKERMFYTDSVFRLVDSVRDVHNGLWESYIPRVKRDESYPDSALFYFRKDLPDVDFSLSRRLDKSRNMKLLSARFVYLPSIDPNSKKKIPQREIAFFLHRNPVPNEAKILNFLERIRTSY